MLPVVGRAVEGAVEEGPVARVVVAAAEVVPTPDERAVGSIVVIAGMFLFGCESDSEPMRRQHLQESKRRINGRKRIGI